MRKSEDTTTLINYRSIDPEWATWSMMNHSEEELRNTYLNDPDKVCTTYICRYSTLSEDFIEELIVLSTGLFANRPDLYTESNREFLKKILFIESIAERSEYVRNIDLRKVNKENYDFVKELKLFKGNIRSKVDWWQIANYQNLSKEFKIKFAKKFNEARIRSDNEFARKSVE